MGGRACAGLLEKECAGALDHPPGATYYAQPLVIAPEHLIVPCISESCLLSCFVNKVHIITSELIMCGFGVRLNTGGDHGDFWGDNNFGPIHQEERCLPRGPA
jgi:hypothetical protein